jgi:DNA-binding CsgD family transcriptional regulator
MDQQHVTRHPAFETVGLLYDAALGHASWHDIGARLTSLIDGATLTLTAQYAPNGGIDLVDMRGVTPREVELYATHYLADDLWRNAALDRRIVNRVVLNSELVSNLDWQNSRIYTDLCVPNTDVFHGVMVTGTLPDGGIYSLGIHRPRKSKPFGQSAAQQLDHLLPHLGRALQVRSRFAMVAAGKATSTAVMDKFSFGVLQVSGVGRVVSANLAAQSILEANDGLSLTRFGLLAAGSGDNQRLQASISRAIGAMTTFSASSHAGAYLRIARHSGLRSYSVIVTPLGLDRALFSPQQAAAMLLITDPEAGPHIDSAALVGLFGFTAAEARLVALLVTGLPLPEVAKRLGVSFETARTHLARARAKTGTTSQVDLVRAILVALSPLQTSR